VKAVGSEADPSKRAVILHQLEKRRESFLMLNLAEALKEQRHCYVQTFRFGSEKRSGTSHYLVGVSKHKRGYTELQTAMAKHSDSHLQGVPSFAFMERAGHLQLKFGTPLDDLVNMLPRDFSGREATIEDIWLKHSPGRNYTIQNYKEALRQLLENGRITASKQPRGNGWGSDARITFPSRD
jgi:hypothetical protein